MVKIKINTNNEAFNDTCKRNYEVARILKKLANQLEEGCECTWDSVILVDYNGNVVGNYIYDPIDK